MCCVHNANSKCVGLSPESYLRRKCVTRAFKTLRYSELVCIASLRLSLLRAAFRKSLTVTVCRWLSHCRKRMDLFKLSCPPKRFEITPEANADHILSPSLSLVLILCFKLGEFVYNSSFFVILSRVNRSWKSHNDFFESNLMHANFDKAHNGNSRNTVSKIWIIEMAIFLELCGTKHTVLYKSNINVLKNQVHTGSTVSVIFVEMQKKIDRWGRCVHRIMQGVHEVPIYFRNIMVLWFLCCKFSLGINLLEWVI